MRFRRLVPILLLGLCACNMAVSDHPMFAPNERLATPLKDGLWAADDPDCPVDLNTPTDKWPNCAFWAIVHDNGVVEVSGDKKEDRPVGFVIAGGEPPIVQIDMVEKEGHAYLFYAIEPAASDASGAVTALNLWAVACGTEKVPGSTSQIDPYPGLDNDCQPSSTDALRAAAAASRAAQLDTGRMKWVRAEPR